MDHAQFDLKLAQECARAFSGATGLGCTLSDADGHVIHDYGHSCERCRLCACAGVSRERLIQVHIYGMTQAERFGGKYIYFCPMGLTCFVSPILGEDATQAKITVGPFIMVERQDFIDCELKETAGLSGEELLQAIDLLADVPFVSPQRVTQLSTLLFMSVGFINNVAAENRLLESDRSDAIQGQMTAYIMTLKQENSRQNYPFDLERKFLQSIERRDKPGAQRLLNELLGAILFADGGSIELMKTRVFELVVLISRTAVNNGADAQKSLQLNHEYFQKLIGFHTIDSLCLWLSSALNGFMDELFTFSGAKHANVIHRCIQYIGEHYNEPITLVHVARMVYLSPSYLSRVFKQETGVTFNEHLNTVRINRAKELLLNRNLRLTDISLMVGFEDQSYFTKVFKRVTGMLPRQYREKKLGK